MPSQPRFRVLIVEDDWFLACAAVAAVEAVGAKALGPFPCPIDAEEALTANATDTALLDIGMQDDTTFALARRLKGAGIPLVFHSYWTQSDIPADLVDVPLVPKWKGATVAVASLVAVTG